jgi:Tol biopolymer transport system component
LLSNPNFQDPAQWSRDGQFIVYRQDDPKTREDIWVLPMAGSKKGTRFSFLQTESNELMGQLSPDNQWMAYTSDFSGSRQVYVRPFPRGERLWTISKAGGQAPRWDRDGKGVVL